MCLNCAYKLEQVNRRLTLIETTNYIDGQCIVNQYVLYANGNQAFPFTSIDYVEQVCIEFTFSEEITERQVDRRLIEMIII